MRRTMILLGLLVAVVLLPAGSALAADATVTYSKPGDVTITYGESVTWKNDDPLAEHQLYIEGKAYGPENGKPIPPLGSYTLKNLSVGTFAYGFDDKADKAGTVKVVAAATTTTAAPATTTTAAPTTTVAPTTTAAPTTTTAPPASTTSTTSTSTTTSTTIAATVPVDDDDGGSSSAAPLLAAAAVVVAALAGLSYWAWQRGVGVPPEEPPATGPTPTAL